MAPSVVPSVLVWFALGCALTSSSTTKSVFLQGTRSPQALGRITANLYLFSGASGAVGAIVLGYLARTAVPADLGLLFAAGYLLAGGAFGAVPALRRLAF